MAKSGRKGISRIIWATRYSWQGSQAAFKHEAAFRQELFGGLLLVPFLWCFAQSQLDVLLVVLAYGLLLICELLNSAIEALVDQISDEQHELLGRAKDMGSSAVFVGLVLLFAAISYVFFNYLSL